MKKVNWENEEEKHTHAFLWSIEKMKKVKKKKKIRIRRFLWSIEEMKKKMHTLFYGQLRKWKK